jgi:hypothetical protein
MMAGSRFITPGLGESFLMLIEQTGNYQALARPLGFPWLFQNRMNRGFGAQPGPGGRHGLGADGLAADAAGGAGGAGIVGERVRARAPRPPKPITRDAGILVHFDFVENELDAPLRVCHFESR